MRHADRLDKMVERVVTPNNAVEHMKSLSSPKEQVNISESSVRCLGSLVEHVNSLDKSKEQEMESSMVHLYSLNGLDMCRDKIVIQRLEIVKGDLQQQIENEVRGNAILKASLKTRKQALRKRRLELEQDVSRLQEQLQVVMDLRVAIEVQDEE